MAGLTVILALLVLLIGFLHYEGDAASFEFNGGAESPYFMVEGPEPSVPKYDVGNGTVKCLVLQGEIVFNINYVKTGGETAIQAIKIPEVADAVGGSCSADGSYNTEELKITFNKDWVFTVQVARPPPPQFLRRNLLAEDSTYSWKKLTLNYEVSAEYFDDPDQSALGRKTAEKTEDEGIFQANTQGSYKCNAAEQVQMGDEVQINVEKLQYRAFGETNDDTFTDEGVEECAADKNDDDDDNTVAIVLGSVFGGLYFINLVIVIIVVIRRRKSDYEVM